MVADRADKTDAAAGEADAFRTMLSSVPPLVLPPLMAPSAGAFAAAAVMGFGFANQMAGAYLGFLKGAVETSRLMAEAMGAPEPDAALDAGSAVEPQAVMPRESATIVALKPRSKPVETVAKPAARKPAAKPAGNKKAVARKAAVSAPAMADASHSGLRQLPGMGPKLESLLRARGLGSLEAIAALSKEQADGLDRDLGLDGRIERDGWIEKAAVLARG